MLSHVAPVRIITLSRQFGAGGRLVGERLAAALGWKLWDKELAREVARVAGNPELAYVDEQEMRSTLWERLRGRPAHRAYLAALKEWVDQIAEEGNSVIIGRGAAVLLRYRGGALHVRLAAPADIRVRRTRELDASLDEAAALARCRQMDDERSRHIKYFFGEDVANPLGYHAIINTGQLPPDTTARMLAAVAAPRTATAGPLPVGPSMTAVAPRILTVTSQLGSRETDLVRELARRLKLALWDREALAREAKISTSGDADLADADPQGFERLRHVIAELGRRGDVLVVGWGGLEFLKGHPSALRLSLIAPTTERLRRIMEYRWVNHEVARAVLEESDARREAYYQKYFGIDWRDPLSYDMVLNTAALGPLTADLAVQAASLKWYGGTTDASGEPIVGATGS